MTVSNLRRQKSLRHLIRMHAQENSVFINYVPVRTFLCLRVRVTKVSKLNNGLLNELNRDSEIKVSRWLGECNVGALILAG